MFLFTVFHKRLL